MAPTALQSLLRSSQNILVALAFSPRELLKRAPLVGHSTIWIRVLKADICSRRSKFAE